MLKRSPFVKPSEADLKTGLDDIYEHESTFIPTTSRYAIHSPQDGCRRLIGYLDGGLTDSLTSFSKLSVDCNYKPTQLSSQLQWLYCRCLHCHLFWQLCLSPNPTFMPTQGCGKPSLQRRSLSEQLRRPGLANILYFCSRDVKRRQYFLNNSVHNLHIFTRFRHLPIGNSMLS